MRDAGSIDDAAASDASGQPSTPDDAGADPNDAGVEDAGPVEVLICGNGRIDDGERCDIGVAAGGAGECPTECPPLAACMLQQVVGTLCETHCEPLPLRCEDGDGCCPGDCSLADDNDCSPSCGDGIVQEQADETCEPGSESPCLTQADCDDGDPCTRDVLSGSESNCNTRCDHSPITELVAGDQCCATEIGANANNDGDCRPVCGNGVVEEGEECDDSLGCNPQCELTLTGDQLRCLEDYPGDACRQCECTECTQLALDCFDSGDPTIDMRCTAVEVCGLERNCANRACYCGTSSLCTLPNGPCRQVIEQAAGTTSPLGVDDQARTPGTALYRADQLAFCAVERCSAVCP